MLALLGLRMVRSDLRIHALGCFDMGETAHVCMGASALCSGGVNGLGVTDLCWVTHSF